MPSAPLAISSQSRKKLKAFEFDSYKTDTENKENGHIRKEPMNGQLGHQQEVVDVQSDQKGLKVRGDCPHTPGAKIPFSDLIANPEDTLGLLIQASPLDQIEWRNGPGSSEPSCSAKSAQKRRKRARSSSPISLSQTDRSKQSVGYTDPLDLESIGKSLRTPRQEDPLSTLWTNYAGTRRQDDGNDPVLPPLPPLSSSPNIPALQKKDGLRRTASCGLEWPTSTTKKRRLNEADLYNRAKGIFASKKDAILAKNATNQSRVSILVDSIHQSLLKKTASESDAPSSSSPLPERHMDFLCSPLKHVIPLEAIVEQHEEPDSNSASQEKDDAEATSSEYGDIELDLDDPELLVALQQAATQDPTLHADNNKEFKRAQQDSECATCKPSQGKAMNARSVCHQVEDPKSIERSNDYSKVSAGVEQPRHEDYDDFESIDDDDDEFATELAQLANKVDSQDVTNLDGANELGSTTHPPQQKLLETATGEFDDAFDDSNDDENEGNDLWAALDARLNEQTKNVVDTPSQIFQDHRTIKRYLVQEIHESQYKTSSNRNQAEKILSIKDEKQNKLFLVHLRQSWYDTRCTKDSYIHLIGDIDRYGSCVVDDENNMVILHPDHLISATVVADSYTCSRRAVLQDRVKATSAPEPPQVYGHLIHEVFGEALRQNSWSFDKLLEIVERLVPNYVESLFEINVQVGDAIEYVMSKMPELTGWANVFVTGRLDSEATIRDRYGAFVPMAIDKLLELEEHVWSPMYGLKGNIDATVQAQMQLPDEKLPRTLTLPLELKTGKRDSNPMHRAQTALYTLLLSDRYDINVTSGILYYLETTKTFRIEGVRNEIRDMIIQRNELACYVHDKLDLPPMVNREQVCKKCYAKTTCFTYHKLIENGDCANNGMKEIFEEAVGHLNAHQGDFLKKWDKLLTQEERDAMKFKRELWTMLSKEREALGRCFGGVVIEPGSAIENLDAPKINRYTYSFTKHKTMPGFSFTESQITVGDPIVISDEKGHFALANGFVTNTRPHRITVAVDRRLQNARTQQRGFDQERNQVFSAIMEVVPARSGCLPMATNPETLKIYRIDKDEFANGMATARNNLLRIMEKDLWRAKELRRLVIDQREPIFKQASTNYTLTGPASQQNLNVDQQKAIEKVMNARDYALVLGMPGTGKTTTIAHIIRALVSQGKSVLLTSYTHTAVDNILLKIKDDNIPILRLGSTGKVHPDVASFVDLGGIPKKTIPELETSWTRSQVVATTCLGINHPVFNHRKFDYCIVDEASQITLPVCLGPIRLASTFILVGDHFQLPPLVQNKEAQEGGLDVSLFKLLSDAQPSSVVNLEHQYRMAEDVMLLSNELIYNGRLKCGNAAVASRLLHIPNLSDSIESFHYTSSSAAQIQYARRRCIPTSTPCWLIQAVDPLNRVLFLNTDKISPQSGLGAPETVSGHGTRITNAVEASLTAQLLAVLVRSGVAPKTIGVITFYRSQLALLKSTVKSIIGSKITGDIEMHTADKYQGRDKEVILLSCVRSNDHHNVGELLKDWRRVNVALTRARSKLIILGSLDTLGRSSVPVLEGMSQILTTKNWVLDLPESVLDLHRFEGLLTQTQTQSAAENRNQQGTNGAALLHASVDVDVESTSGKPGQRIPLGEVSGNVTRAAGSRKPAKVVKGGVNVDKYLQRHPVTRDIMMLDDESIGIYPDV